MAEIVHIEDNLPHVVREVICVECKRRWLACAPASVLLRDYECPNGHIGFVVATGCPEIVRESDRRAVDGDNVPPQDTPARPRWPNVTTPVPSEKSTPAARRRPRHLRRRPPKLTEDMILAWCEDHRARTGSWPTNGSGVVLAAPGETWAALDGDLNHGFRGLPGGSSLAKLLATRRGTRNKKGLPPLTEEAIIALADAHRGQTGEWPTRESGAVFGSLVPGETWKRINDALVKGLRGLPTKSSLAKLLAAHRGVRNRKALPPLTEELILQWADAHFAKHGVYPSESAGAVEGAPGEVWNNVTMALRQGTRGLSGGSSLFRLLCKYGRVSPLKVP